MDWIEAILIVVAVGIGAGWWKARRWHDGIKK